MLKITDVEYIKEFELLLTFNDGKVKRVDLKDKLNGSIFEPLKDRRNFIQFGLIHGTIEWSCGADVAPEYLYEIGE